MFRRISFVFLGLLLTISLLLMGGCAKDSDDVVIGEYTSMTGTTADFGKTTHNGTLLAIEQINQRGGLLGKKVRLVLEDDRSDPAEAKTVVTKLVTRDKVVAVLGEVASTRTMTAAPVCQQAGVPMISPASTNPRVTDAGDCIFRVCFTDDFQGAVNAKFAAEHLKVKSAAILKDIKNDYSMGLAESFAATFKKLGGTVVAEESYSEGDTDFSSQITSIKAKNPEIIFVPGYYTEVSLIAIKARQLGIKVPFLGGDGWDSPSLIRNAGKALEGSYFSNHFSPESDVPSVKMFVEAYEKRYGEVPNALAALGYDATWILAEAIKRAGTTDRRALRDAIAATVDHPGATGTITIDENRNARKPAVMIQIVNGKFKQVESIIP